MLNIDCPRKQIKLQPLDNSLRPLWAFISFEVYSVQVLLLTVKTWYSSDQNRLPAILSYSVPLIILILVIMFFPYPFHSHLFCVQLRTSLHHCFIQQPCCDSLALKGKIMVLTFMSIWLSHLPLCFVVYRRDESQGKIVLRWNRQKVLVLWQGLQRKAANQKDYFVDYNVLQVSLCNTSSH